MLRLSIIAHGIGLQVGLGNTYEILTGLPKRAAIKFSGLNA